MRRLEGQVVHRTRSTAGEVWASLCRALSAAASAGVPWIPSSSSSPATGGVSFPSVRRSVSCGFDVRMHVGGLE